jgi:hypothetical protein
MAGKKQTKLRAIFFWAALTAVAGGIVAYSTGYSVAHPEDKGVTFARSGSILCLAGAVIVIRDLFIEGFDFFVRYHGLGGFADYELKPERKREAWVTIGGVAVVGFGTLVWAYGDLAIMHFIS